MCTGNSTLSRGSLRRSMLIQSNADHRTGRLGAKDRFGYLRVITFRDLQAGSKTRR
jgi:hypothetical protein